jgi:hypothetical protein
MDIIVKRGVVVSATMDVYNAMIVMNASAMDLETIILHVGDKIYRGQRYVAKLIHHALRHVDDDPTHRVIVAAFQEARRAGWLAITDNGSLYLPVTKSINGDN